MKSDYEIQIESLTEIQANIKAQIAALQAKQAAYAALIASSSLPVRKAAVAIHSMLCTQPHDSSAGACTWQTVGSFDDAAQADWTEAAHSLWLDRAKNGIAKLREIGFTIADPAPTP